ncbi:hypothetical protein DFAR_2920002 [Desulfarculales bacterium]
MGLAPGRGDGGPRSRRELALALGFVAAVTLLSVVPGGTPPSARWNGATGPPDKTLWPMRTGSPTGGW